MPIPVRPNPVYAPTVGPVLRAVLVAVFAGVAVLAASGAYLSAVRGLEWATGRPVTSAFTLWALLAHVGLGLLLAAPFVGFGVAHWRTARGRPNRAAVRRGLGVFGLGLAVVGSGLALVQLDGLPQLQTGTPARWAVLAVHVVAPVAAVALYVAHRRAGPPVRWRWAAGWAAGTAGLVAAAAALHHHDPARTAAVAPAEGEQYFHPAATRTADGKFLDADTLMMDRYCLQCHPDAYHSWFHSAHHFSSFNNPPYLFSVRETRKVALARDGDVRAARWCAGCHDPVPFLSGAFDDPGFDDVSHPTAHAGITCTVCHAVERVNGPEGNGGYTLAEPQHYPFARSESAALQWVNRQLVRAKPDFHKRTFLKPVHKSAEFCAACHKVSLPPELNHYKEFLRGQNHYDSFLLSGVGGHGARAFYYPEKAKENCAACHMPAVPSGDPAARDFAGTGTRTVHDHLFPAANTGLPWLLSLDPKHAADADGFRAAAGRHADFLRGTAPDGSDRKLRVDIFGLKEDGRTDGRLLAPLRPELPTLVPGRTYLVEVVVRTLGVGHHFTQGTADSNEVWVEFAASAGGRVIGESGRLAGPGDAGPLDPWAHRVNLLALDRHGNRIDRRNPQDIFTPLYDHQIPPGAGQVVHFALDLPADLSGSVELTARVRYRKFDHAYMAHVHGGADKVPALPVTDLCDDRVTLPVAGRRPVQPQDSPIRPAWQRWNDYGIGCFLEGGAEAKRGELRQAEAAFLEVTRTPAAAGHGWLNAARVRLAEGRLPEAVSALNAAKAADPPPPWWLLAWFTGVAAAENAAGPADLDAAADLFARILDPGHQPTARGFDFTRDYVVRNKLADTLFKRATLEDGPAREPFLRRAVAEYRRTFAAEPEDLDAHYGLSQCFARLAADLPTATPPAADPDAAAGVMADPARPAADRSAAAAGLAVAVRRLGDRPFDPKNPRLPTVKRLLAAAGPAADDPDPAVRGAAAAALAELHRQAHALLRPDDNARARAAAAHRAAHPPADLAAEAVPIYPLRRPGAKP